MDDLPPYEEQAAGKPAKGTPGDPVRLGVVTIARIAALCGGTILLVLVGTVLLSVAGRALVPFGFTSIRGDFELVSAGVAVAAFLSLGWAHLRGGHAAVDLVAERFPERLQAPLATMVHLLVALAAAFLAWRLAAGALDRHTFGDTTQLLRLPLVWPYGAASFGASVFALVALFCALHPLTGSAPSEGTEIH